MARNMNMESVAEQEREPFLDSVHPAGPRRVAKITAAVVSAFVGCAIFLVAASHQGETTVASSTLRGSIGLHADTPKIFMEHGVNYTIQCGETFELKKVLHSNLGNKGPDSGDEGIRILADQMENGELVRHILIQINAKGEYTPWMPARNGLNGDFGAINMLTGHSLPIEISFLDVKHEKPLTMKEIHMTAYDLDADMKLDTATEELLKKEDVEAAREFVRAYGPHTDSRPNTTTVQKNDMGDHVLYSATVVAVPGDNPSDPKALTTGQKNKAVGFKYDNVDTIKLELGSTKGKNFRIFEFAFLNMLACKKVVVLPPAKPFPWMLVAMGVGGLLAFLGLCFLLYWCCRPLTKEERIAKAKKEGEHMAKRAHELLSAPNPDYTNAELVAIVNKLKSHKSYVKALCGAPWNEWSAPGECQVCKCKVDRKEKGLHCANGGHRICWKCMCGEMDWEKMAEDELKAIQDAANKQ